MWDKLSIDSSLLIKGTRVCIHPELLDHTLADVHGAHQGINRMWAQVREAVYWPSIDADIADYACWCTICTKQNASPPAQPMLPQDIPDGPWQEIAADYFTHKGKEYLLISNQFSKYTLLYKVSTHVCPVSVHPCSSLSCRTAHHPCCLQTMDSPLHPRSLDTFYSTTT